MINQGPPGGPGSLDFWLWLMTQGGGGSAPSSPGGGYDPYGQYPVTINGIPQDHDTTYNYGVPGDRDYFIDQGGHGGTGSPVPSPYTPGGTLYDQLENPGRPGYMHTGGGVGYTHGNPEDEQRAWQLFLDMKRNGWDPYAPGSIEEARRGMGEFTEEAFNEYFRNFILDQKRKQDPANPDDSPSLGKWNDILVSALGKGKLGKLGLGKWLKNAQEGATFDDWLKSLDPNQLDYIDEWMTGLGADKNWEDRLRQGEAPWSRTGEAIDKTQRQNPNGPDLVNNEDDPRIGGGKRNPPDKPGGGGDEPEGSYDGPFGLPAYAGMAFSPSFLAYQPYNTNGPVQFVPGRK